MTDAERIAEIKQRLGVHVKLPETLSTMSYWYAVDVDFLLRRIDALAAENARLRGPWQYDPQNNTYTANVNKEK